MTAVLTATVVVCLIAVAALARRVAALRRELTERARVHDRELIEHKRLFDLSLDLLCVTTFDGYVTVVNPQFEKSLGWSHEELLSTPFLEFVHPDDRGATLAEIERLQNGTPTINFRNRALCKDGTYKMLAWKAMPDTVAGTTYCVGRDITEDNQLLRSFVDNVDQVLWMNDAATRRVLYVSPAYATVWGRPCTSLYSRPLAWLDAIHSDDRARVEEAFSHQYETGSFTEQYRIVRPDGTIRWIRDRGIPVRNSAGEIARMVGMAEDITDYKETEERLRQSERLATVGTLAAGIAHEINNPIGAIQLAAQSRIDTPGTPESVQRALRDVLREADRCARIVESVLTFAREATSEKQAVDFNEVVKRAVGLAREQVVRNGTSVDLALAAGLPYVSLNETEIEQVLVNLVQNACEAKACKVSVRTDPSGKGVRLTVEDDGVGIPADVARRIFEPFYTTRRERGGTGLGLSITHGIVTDHNGRIQVESEPGRGTRMILEFPAEVAHISEERRNGQSTRC